MPVIEVTDETEVHESHCNSCILSSCQLAACPIIPCPNHCGFRLGKICEIIRTSLSTFLHFYFCNPRLHSCKLPDHLSEICPLQQVLEPLLSYSDHFEKNILLLCCLCLAVMVCYDVDERHLWPGSLHQCLLRLSPPTPQTAQGHPSWGQSLPLSIFNKFEVYGKFYLSNQTHPLNINSTVPPASWFAANLGIGVGGHWGRIVRARCGPLSAR